MSNSAAFRIHQTQLYVGMRVVPCNRKRKSFRRGKNGECRAVYRVMFQKDSTELALYREPVTRVDAFMSRGINPERWTWFVPTMCFPAGDLPPGIDNTRVVVFSQRELISHLVEGETQVLELVVHANGKGKPEFLTYAGEEYVPPPGSYLIPTGKVV